MVEPAEAPKTLPERNREALLRGFARFGADPDELRRDMTSRMGMTPESTEIYAFNEMYVERLPPMSALFVGAETPYGRWEVIDFLAACYPTVGSSFRQIGRHFGLINPNFEFVADPGGAGVLPYVEFRHRLRPRHEFFDEYTTGIFLAHFRTVSRTHLRLTALHSVRERPADPAWCAEIAEFLGCMPTWGARHGRMVFSREAWDTPLFGGNPRLREALEAHATELARELDAAQGFGARVRAVIAQTLRDGEPRIADVAQRLGMTARTLQRRLQDEALGFTALVDEARLSLARRYLADESLSISEVSFALGYSEPSAFTRAFKRWSGHAPAEFREAARADQS